MLLGSLSFPCNMCRRVCACAWASFAQLSCLEFLTFWICNLMTFIILKILRIRGINDNEKKYKKIIKMLRKITSSVPVFVRKFLLSLQIFLLLCSLSSFRIPITCIIDYLILPPNFRIFCSDFLFLFSFYSFYLFFQVG